VIARVLGGDTAAAKLLYDRHVRAVYRLAYRMAGDEELAKDWTQETFVRAFSRLAQFRGESSFSTWLLTVANSVSLNGLRKVTQVRRRETELEEAVAVVRDEPGESTELRQRIDYAIDRLPEKYRAVFVMYDIEGYSHTEIATSLGISPIASKVQLSRARSKLRTQLADLMIRG
jgi:RNA polymerase sigma-70 factor (ECF subfamily)